jgi:hypothetical protein
MSAPTDGGPAFPVEFGTAGMTLRDWFAGMALSGLIITGDERHEECVAKDAFAHADAMLTHRMKEAQ